MIKAEHLTDEQFARFRNRTLEPAELLDVDQHLAVCGVCSERLWREMAAPGQVSALRDLLSEHLEYAQIVVSAEGKADAAVEQHLAGCAMCRADVEDLRAFQAELKAPRKVVEMPARRSGWRIPTYVAIAAGLVLSVSLVLRILHREQPLTEVPLVGKAVPPAEAPLAPEQQAAVQLALSTHRLERAGVLDRLITKRGVLLGAPGEQKSFAVTAPVGTAVINDRPVLRWEALPGAGKYVVAVFDDQFQRVAESPALTGAEWTPERALARGQIYTWQVTAHVGGRTLLSPAPPAPEARFQVAGLEAVTQIESARREHPGNHLLLAVLLAKVGALDDASLELDALAATDAATAQALRTSLVEIRKQ